MGTVRGFGLNFTAMSAEVAEQPSGPPARQVVYCGVCSLPPEYCEFGGTVKKCEEWLLKHHPDIHQKLYSAEALSANLSALSVEAQKRAEKDAAKKTAKAEAVILIKRVERNKRKYVTVVSGLEEHGLELK